MFTNIEEKGLKEAGFADDEIVELNSIKEAMENVESNLERALSVAMTGVLYFAGGKVDIAIDGIEMNGLPGYRVSATSEKGLHAVTALVLTQENADSDVLEPVEIQYGVRLNTAEPCTVNILEKDRFNGDVERFVGSCLVYLKLAGYSFIVGDSKEDEKEVKRHEFLAGDSLRGIVQRPIDGDIDTINFVKVQSVSEKFELSHGA